MFSKFFSENVKERRNVERNALDILTFLSVELGERTLRKYENLQRTREFINNYFVRFGHQPYEDIYVVNKKEVANIIVEIPGFENPDEIVVLGAHYDTIEGTPGADDNGSAIAGLLEIYRLLSHFKFKKTIRFVAFTLEEPPFFDTELMGSMHYATLCKKRKDNIVLMVCLEMIGFGWKKIEQEFPPHEIRMKAPKTGNFLTVVSLPSSCQYTYLWKKIYNSHAKNKIFDIVGPASIPGIALSDHASFVKNGYPGIMLCDTGFYRNKNYHTEDDTINTINFVFLAQNIMYSFFTLKEILNMGLLNFNHFEEEK